MTSHGLYDNQGRIQDFKLRVSQRIENLKKELGLGVDLWLWEGSKSFLYSYRLPYLGDVSIISNVESRIPIKLWNVKNILNVYFEYPALW